MVGGGGEGGGSSRMQKKNGEGTLASFAMCAPVRFHFPSFHFGMGILKILYDA